MNFTENLLLLWHVTEEINSPSPSIGCKPGNWPDSGLGCTQLGAAWCS